MVRKLLCALAGGALIFASPSAAAQGSSAKQEKAFEDLMKNVIRGISFDICYPATSEEYEALGKNVIIKLDTYSAMGTELPLRAVYIMAKGTRVPLQRIAIEAKTSDEPKAGETAYTRQASFYLLPVQLMKTDARLLGDFTGARSEFGITTFSSKKELDAPAFVRLDEYDGPIDPDMTVVRAVLIREYPDNFPDPG